MPKDILTRKDQTDCNLWIQGRAEEKRYVRKYLKRILSSLEEAYLDAFKSKSRNEEYAFEWVIKLMLKDAPICADFPDVAECFVTAKRHEENLIKKMNDLDKGYLFIERYSDHCFMHALEERGMDTEWDHRRYKTISEAMDAAIAKAREGGINACIIFQRKKSSDSQGERSDIEPVVRLKHVGGELVVDDDD